MKQIDRRTQAAKKLYQELLDILALGDVLAWEEGRIWHELHKTKLFQYVFGDEGEKTENDSWIAFLRSTPRTQSTVESRIRLYEFYVAEKKIPLKVLKKIPDRKSLDRAIPIIKAGKKNIVEVLEFARELPYSQFKGWLNE